ncbi:phosphoglycerate kinase [Candidatus Woesearchaeota archaeon]|nr:phosphoglycerate kinase [Candidatus Woesearchaeota archaeon]|tara:strand:- start:2390 stop:3559 length:1170 start_codon:yes stop_codon:yes gene_type:complete
MFKTLKDIDVSGKKVIVRVGMDVPVDEDGDITDDTRIIDGLPTIKYLLKKKAKLILLTKIGRPKGKRVERLSVKKTAAKLSKLVGVNVKAFDECVGDKVEAVVNNMKDGEIVFLENVLFYKEEKEKDTKFAKKLASYGEIYVNDAFSSSHRDTSSMTLLPKLLPSCAGILLEKEIDALNNLLENPKKPFIAVLGGAKVSDKIKLIENLLKRVDKILIGGAMAFTFLKAQGISVGESLVENDFIENAKKLLKSGKIVLQVDVVIADKMDAKAKNKTVSIDNIENGWLGLDIGPETVKLFSSELKKANTIVWNGPMGVFEMDNFAKGTIEIAKSIEKSKATTLIGGGDTISAARKAKVEGKFTHTSTGGGAMLEFLEGKKLPAIEALEKSS